MDPQENIPERSKLWLEQKNHKVISSRIFDPVTKAFLLFLLLFTFIIFWPIVLKIKFEAVFYTPSILLFINSFKLLAITPQNTTAFIYIMSFIIATGGIYLLVHYLTKRQSTSIFASLIYIIWPIPIFILLFLTGRVYESGLVSPASFLSIFYGDVDYFLALALIPYAALFYLNYLKYGRRIDLVLSVILGLIILLTNQSQSLSLILVLSVITLTEIFLGQLRLKLKRYLIVLFISIGLASFWYVPIALANPSAIFSSHVISNLKFLFPLPVIVGILSLIISFAFFAKRQDRQTIFLSFLLFIIFISLIGDWLINGRSYVAHPNRLIPDLVMFGSIVLALLATAILDRINIAKMVNFEAWILPKKIIGAIIFAIVSFFTLSMGAFILTPIGIRLVTGEGGVWTKIRLEMISDRNEAIALAGGNLKLFIPAVNSIYWWIGVILTAFFVTLLGFILFKMKEPQGGNNFENE